jgi:hypothetical protein
MYGVEIKFIKGRLNPASLMFCMGWGGSSQQKKNLLGYGSLSCITALCHQYVTLSLISAPRHKTAHCTAEARFAVPFSDQWRTLVNFWWGGLIKGKEFVHHKFLASQEYCCGSDIVISDTHSC